MVNVPVFWRGRTGFDTQVGYNQILKLVKLARFENLRPNEFDFEFSRKCTKVLHKILQFVKASKFKIALNSLSF